MWPFRPEKLTDLLDTAEIRGALDLGPALRLQSDVAVVLPGDGDALLRVDPDQDVLRELDSPFCSFLRRGTIDDQLAFEGADEVCADCEARLARKGLSAPDGTIVRSRCHMGLTDLAAPIAVGERVLGTVVAGQRVETDAERARITKRVGKIGKLTRGELRSLEEANAPLEAPIRPADPKARDQLLREVARIPPFLPEFEERLRRLAGWFSRQATSRLGAFRRKAEDALLDRLFPPNSATPTQPEELLEWLFATVCRLREALALEHLAFFASPLDSEESREEAIPLVAESGLSPVGQVFRDDNETLAELDTGRLPPASEGRDACVDRALAAVSTLISAVRTSEGTPAEWKDRLTKSLFVAAIEHAPNLRAVLLFGPSLQPATPEPADFVSLWRLTRAVAERYLLGRAEVHRCRLAREVKVLRPRPKAIPRTLIRTQRFDLTKLVHQALEALSAQATARSVSFDTRGLPDRLMMEADRPKVMAILHRLFLFAIENARPGTDASAPSVLVSLRRPRRKLSRVTIVIDVVGRFLDADERRALLREAPRARTAKEPQPHAESEAPHASPQSATSGGAPRDVPSGAAAAEEREAITFREAQRYATWHRGSLHIESIRTQAPDEAEGDWLGRTVLSLSLPKFQERPRQPPGADKDGDGEAAAPPGKPAEDEPRGRRRPRQGTASAKAAAKPATDPRETRS